MVRVQNWAEVDYVILHAPLDGMLANHQIHNFVNSLPTLTSKVRVKEIVKLEAQA